MDSCLSIGIVVMMRQCQRQVPMMAANRKLHEKSSRSSPRMFTLSWRRPPAPMCWYWVLIFKKRQHNCWIWGEIERRNGQFFWYSNRKIVVGVPSPLQVVYGGSKAEPLGEAACRNSENKRRQASVLILTEHGIHEGETQTYTLRIAETVVHHTIHVTKWWTWGPANLLGKKCFPSRGRVPCCNWARCEVHQTQKKMKTGNKKLS